MSNLFRFLFPRLAERQIASRYFYTKASSKPSSKTLQTVLLILLGMLCLATEAAYFLFAASFPILIFPAILLPLLFTIVLLLRFFSVFSTVSIMGVALGVATLIVVNSVATGFIIEIRQRLTGTYGHFYVSHDKRAWLSQREYLQLSSQLKKSSHVVAAAPFIQQEMFIAKPGWPPLGVGIAGIDLEEAPKLIELERWLRPKADGQLPKLAELSELKVPNQGGPALPSIYLGDVVARQLELKVGDKIQLLNIKGLFQFTGSEEDPNSDVLPSQEFYLAGTIYTGFEKIDKEIACISLAQAQALMGNRAIANGVLVRLDNQEKVPELSRSIVQELSGHFHIPYKATVQEEKNILKALESQKSALSLVIFLIILVGSFNVIANLTILVITKIRAIAILKTIGMNNFSVAGIFRSIGTRIGLWGTTLGVGFGLLVCMIVRSLKYGLEAKVYMIDHLPMKLSPYEVVGIAVVTLLICAFATLYPALRAAKLHPVDGLRQE